MAQQTPLEKMLEAFPHARDKGNGWFANDDNPRFDFREEDDGHIVIHSWTGRDAETILGMGKVKLKYADLYVRGGNYTPKYREKQLDLLSLSHYLKLPWQFLEKIGYSDGYTYINKQGKRTKCVKLGGYTNPDGSAYSKDKVRLNLDGKTRFLWNQRTPGDPIPCGYHRLSEAVAAGYLIIGEGESDAATNWFHGFPFLGISGADGVKYLDVSLLAGIPRIYVIEEPDQVQKLSETGLGFYASMQAHLRAKGYEGEIFSIRFKLATGYKDPSSLHKTVYRQCDVAEEAPHLAEVKAKFADVMFKAMERALPEGNMSLATQEDFEADPPPPLPDTDSDFRQWCVELWQVDAAVMSPAHKIVLMVVMQHFQTWSYENGDWWQVDASHLAARAGMPKKQFLVHLAYLTNILRLFIKFHDRKWETDEKTGKPTVKTCDLYIMPSRDVKLRYPSTYHVVDGAPERKHGGKQEPKPECVKCHRTNIKVYTAHYCLDCKHMEIIRDDQEEQEPIESTAQVLPMEPEEKILLETQVGFSGVFSEDSEEPETVGENNTPETPKIGTSIYIDNVPNIDVPGVFSESSEKILLETQVGFSGVFPIDTHHELNEASVIHALHAEKGEPCTKCGCPLYHKDHWCCRCLPRGFPDDIWKWLTDRYSVSQWADRKQKTPVAKWEVAR